MITFSEENYLKAIFHLAKSPSGLVSTNAIAEQMQTKASSVTDMVKKLADKSLIDYKKYQGVCLTEKGRNHAVMVIRKHRLWEVFLVEKLHFSWDEVHEVAEQLEHIKSEKLIKELDAFLEYPKTDPHGDPIPDQNGNIISSSKVLLANLKPGESGICVGVNNTTKSFLQYLDKKDIALGKKITVLEKEPFDNSLLITFKKQQISISAITANNLFVQKI